MSDKVTMHPNSLANLAPQWGSRENAQKAQVASVAKRKANKEAREALKMNMKDWAAYKVEVLDNTNMSSLDVLKILMMKALEKDDYDTAADLAKSIAEFEQPKLARIESRIEEVSANDMTDEELEAKLKEYALGKDDSSKDT